MARTLRNKNEATRWWHEQVEGGRLVVARGELPAGPGRRLLLAGGLAAEVANGQAWILKTPDREADEELCVRSYWRIVEAVLANYRPAVVERESAVRLYLGEATPPRLLRIRHAGSKSRYRFEICDRLEVQLMPGDVSLETARAVALDGAEVRIDRPERTLLALPLSTVRDSLDAISVWLSTLTVSRPALEEEWARASRPVLLKRFSEMARDAGNERLHELLENFLAAEHGQHVSRARVGVGSEVVVPRIVSGSGSAAPWLLHHRVAFRRYVEQMEETLAGEIVEPSSDRPELIRRAADAKTHDAYHSTTIEGYHITPDEVAAVLAGREVHGQDPERVKARMAVRGYSAAFDRCVSLLWEADGPVRITGELVQDLYGDLFSPSAEAGIVDAATLRGWRTEPAYLRGARYVPPSAEKVPELVREHVQLVDELTGNPLVRASLAHLDFVRVHPFPDGNGRIARFLMNLVLVRAGLPWTTIRAEERLGYFQALETATVEGDARPFALFVLERVRRATMTT